MGQGPSVETCHSKLNIGANNNRHLKSKFFQRLWDDFPNRSDTNISLRIVKENDVMGIDIHF